MLVFVTIIHVLLCVFMIFVILLQPGKDAGMGAALGGGAATSAFGGRGAVTFLSKVTAVCATLFFITSLGLSFVGLRQSVAAGGETPAPAAAAGTAPASPGEPAKPDLGTSTPTASGIEQPKAEGQPAPAPAAPASEPAPAKAP
jgi:preprotein translocase subunit SecG